jgi:hypothetical protein
MHPLAIRLAILPFAGVLLSSRRSTSQHGVMHDGIRTRHNAQGEPVYQVVLYAGVDEK